MQKKHVDALKAFEDNLQLEQELDVSRKLKNKFTAVNESEQSTFEGILAGWVSRDLRPASIVADAGFIDAIKFANNAQGTLVVPSRQTVTMCVNRLAYESRLSLRDMLMDDEQCEYYSVPSDIWTSITCESYISFTIHYVTKDFCMQSWILEVRLIPGKHDGGSIARALSECFAWWCLDPKMCVRFLRDGASNITSACSKLGLTHRSCAAHSLHLVVGAALLMKSQERASVETVDADGTVTSDGNQGQGIVSADVPAPSVHGVLAAASDSTAQNIPVTSGNFADPILLEVRAAAGLSGDTIPQYHLATAGIHGDVGAQYATGNRENPSAHDAQMRLSWIDERLMDLEIGEEVGNDSGEFVSDADLDFFVAQVATFVTETETAAHTTVSVPKLESVRRLVCEFRKLARYFHRSQKGSNRLDELQKHEKHPVKVIIDCPTRWNSTTDMLLRFSRTVAARSAYQDATTSSYMNSTLAASNSVNFTRNILKEAHEQYLERGSAGKARSVITAVISYY